MAEGPRQLLAETECGERPVPTSLAIHAASPAGRRAVTAGLYPWYEIRFYPVVDALTSGYADDRRM